MTLGLASPRATPATRPTRVGELLEESALFRGYASGSTSTTCLCGGVIEAVTLSSTDVLRAVQEHNATLQHQGWRAETSLIR